MVYWWIVVCYKIGDRFYLNPKHMCRGDIENVLQTTIDILRGSDSWFAKEILKIDNFSEFNVDQFCKEMKDYFTAETQIAELNQELNKLVESEKNLKEILKNRIVEAEDMDNVNNSGEKAKWIKSEIPGEEYVCSLCGSACWYYDAQKGVAQSRFCPNCGAKMSKADEFVDVDELIDLCENPSNIKLSLNRKAQKQISGWLGEYKVLLKRNAEMKVAYMTNERNDGILRGKCPKCSTAVSSREDVNFCGTCGQRLGWRLW